VPLKAPTNVAVGDLNKVAYINSKSIATDDKSNPVVLDLHKIALKISPMRISGTVFNDSSNYNSKNDDNAYLPKVKVNLLDTAGNLIDSTETDSFGKYYFDTPTGKETSSFNGKYQVQFVKPSGYIVSNKGTTNDPSESDIDITNLKTDDLVSGNVNIDNVNAGFALDGSISANPTTRNLFIGDNSSSNLSFTNNASYDATFGTVVNVNSNISASTTSDVISITANNIGSSTITVQAKDGYGRTRTDLRATITVNVKQKISGVIFEDADYNSDNDDTNKFISTEVQLVDTDGKVIATTTTLSGGVYTFEVATSDNPGGKDLKVKVKKPFTDFIPADKGDITNAIKSHINTTEDNGYFLTDTLKYGTANHLNVNAGFARDVEFSLKTASDVNLSTNVDNTVKTDYTLSNGGNFSIVIADTTKFSATNDTTNKEVTFTALAKGDTTATLSIKDGYGRTRTDKNIVINLNAYINKGSIKYHVKFLDNTGNVIDVPSSYLQGFSAKVYDGSTVIAERKLNFLTRISTQENTISDIEQTDGTLKLEVTKPATSSLEIVKDDLSSHDGTYDISYTQGDEHNVNVYVTDKLLPLTEIIKNGEVNNYNPKSFTENHIDNETEIVAKDTFIYTCNEDYSTCDNKVVWNVKTPTKDGYYKVEYQVKDLANNLSETKALEFKVDKTPPSVDLTINNDINPSKDDLSLQVKDNMDNNPVVTWKILLNNRVIASGKTAALQLPSDLKYGDYTVIVNASDEAGNKIEVIKGFNISDNGIQSEIPSTGSNDLIIMSTLMISGIALLFGFKKTIRKSSY
jgi:hypothetical protein